MKMRDDGIWPYRMSPAAINTGSLLSWLVMLSTENWEMLSQLLVWTSGSWEEQVRDAKHGSPSCPLLTCHYLWHVVLPLHSRLLPEPPWLHTIMAFLSYGSHSDVLKV